MNYYGGYYVPGAHPGPQAGWFSQNAGPETWSDSMVHSGPLSPVSASGETMIISDDPISTKATADENIPAPKPNAKGNITPPAPPAASKLPAAPKAKQPPVKPAPDKDDEKPAAGDASPKSASNQLQELQLGDAPGDFEESSIQGLNLPVEVEDSGDGFPNDEPAGALLPE